MNVMIRLLFVSLFLLPFSVWCQEIPEIKKNNFGIGLVPQYGIIHGTRIDLDFRLRSPRQWLIAAPQLYLVTKNSSLWNFNEMSGAGIDVQHRIYLGKNDIPKGAYFAYGPVFQYFSVKDEGLAAYDFREGDVNYIGLNETTLQTKIYKLGGNLIFGYQTLLDEVVYFDFYLGTGMRFSFDNRKSGLHSYYNEWWGDLGYSGTLMVGGFRFGVYF